MKVLYTAVAHATGDGRNGRARTDSGTLDLPLSLPPDMGGKAGFTNPEELFAAGYAACFHSALKVTAGQAGVDVGNSAVSASVRLGIQRGGAFGLAVELQVSVPDVERELAEQLVARAHEVCPYSSAIRGNVDVRVAVF